MNININRTAAVMSLIGWQGGTIHQLCEYLGIDVNKFLWDDKDLSKDSNYTLGLYCSTNSKSYINSYIVPKYKGDAQYWIGAAVGSSLTTQAV